jgi:hypothetical protein
MPQEYVKYFAITGEGSTVDDPRGIVRRRTFPDGGFEDEGLHRDLTWKFTPVIVEWERGDFSLELEEVDEDTAMRITEQFRSGGPH